MLSKVAERVYWAARYLERIESTARLVSIYDKLLFDLPKQVNLGWYNLIVINSLEQDFADRYSNQDERNVVKFLLGDETNPGSVVSSLHAIRENIRTTRDVVPAETWELVNELSSYVTDHLQQGINRSARHEFLDYVIQSCQQIEGLLGSCMPRDEGWKILMLGQNIERADMTTRNLDAGIAAILQIEEDDYAVNSRQTIWGNVLRSLNADQPFRRAMRSSISGEPVVKFLTCDTYFPRSVVYCLSEMIESAEALPHSKDVIKAIKKVHKSVIESSEHKDFGAEYRDVLNDLQVAIQQLHFVIGQTWFLTDR
ncbi:MAG: alpha-E domain-containing protein [Oleibacter sp.]|nr:alpha-E domain-containing protein [Thalassolituus sp.]